MPHLPQGHWAPHPPLLDPPSSPRPPTDSFSSLQAHTDHARKATITPAAAAARPSTQHPSQPAKGVLKCLIGHDQCSLNGLIVFRWIFRYKTRKKEIWIDFHQFCCSAACITGVSFFSLCPSLPSILFPVSFLCHFLSFYLTCKGYFFLIKSTAASFASWSLRAHFWISSQHSSEQIHKCRGGDLEVGLLPFDVKFSCICRSRCQLQPSFIVFVNLYARVLVSEAPDVDFKYLIFHDSMASLWHITFCRVF